MKNILQAKSSNLTAWTRLDIGEAKRTVFDPLPCNRLHLPKAFETQTQCSTSKCRALDRYKSTCLFSCRTQDTIILQTTLQHTMGQAGPDGQDAELTALVRDFIKRLCLKAPQSAIKCNMTRLQAERGQFQYWSFGWNLMQTRLLQYWCTWMSS